MTIWTGEIKELEKLHDSIKGKHPKLDNELQRLIKTDDENIVLVYARRCLEVIITDLSERELKRSRGTEPLRGIIDRLNKEEKIPYNITVSMQNLNSLSTFGAHPKDFDPRQVKPVLLDLTTALDWYIKYLEAQSTDVTEPGVPGKIRKEPAGAKKVAIGYKKRILMASAISLVGVVIVVTLILTDVIKGGKDARAEVIKSLVVLPFENFTGDEKLDYVADGMHASLIGDMGKLGALRVIGKTSSSVFKNTGKSAPDIARELHVDALVEPTVTCYGDSVCIQIRVITPFPFEKQLWVADYREDKSKIVNLYNRIAKQIADELMIELTPEEERLLAKSGIVDRDAYDEYLKGLYYLEDFDKESLMKALGYLNRAVEKDSSWAPLYTNLTLVWASIVQMGFESPEVAGPKIFENMNKALELDPDNSDSRFISGEMAFLAEWDWEKGEKELLKSLAINPNNAIARVIYSQLLCILQRPDEALTQGQLAIELDPFNPLIKVLYSFTVLSVSDCEKALALAEKVTADDPEHYMANNAIESAAFRCGDYDKVMKAAKYILPVRGIDYQKVERVFKKQGFVPAYEEVMRQSEILAQNGYFSPVEMAVRYMMVDQKDKALDWLEKGFKVHDQNMPYITTDAYLCEPLFDNPRFIDIIKKMNLPLPKK
jgi:TolB-like protein